MKHTIEYLTNKLTPEQQEIYFEWIGDDGGCDLLSVMPKGVDPELVAALEEATAISESLPSYERAWTTLRHLKTLMLGMNTITP
jgi:hypothetical protein